jgi:hypothetical protein
MTRSRETKLYIADWNSMARRISREQDYMHLDDQCCHIPVHIPISKVKGGLRPVAPKHCANKR